MRTLILLAALLLPLALTSSASAQCGAQGCAVGVFVTPAESLDRILARRPYLTQPLLQRRPVQRVLHRQPLRRIAARQPVRRFLRARPVRRVLARRPLRSLGCR